MKPRYFVKLCTDAGWQEPVSFDRDWKLKEYRNDMDLRLSLVDDATVTLGVAASDVRCWVVTVDMVER